MPATAKYKRKAFRFNDATASSASSRRILTRAAARVVTRGETRNQRDEVVQITAVRLIAAARPKRAPIAPI
jgi:hypothetical protein